jgi:hypothetical protein
MRDSGYVPTRRLSVVVMTATGVWIDDHPLPLPAAPQVHDAVLDVLVRGARQRDARLTARVVDRVAGGTLTVEVRPDGASNIVRLLVPERDAASVHPGSGSVEAGTADIGDRARTACRRHLEGVCSEAAALWLDLAEESLAGRCSGTADHLVRAAAAWQRTVSGDERWEQARRLLLCWRELADAEGLEGTDRELWRSVYEEYRGAAGGAGKEPGGGSLPAPSWWPARSKPELVHSGVVGGSGPPAHCICFIAACGSALDHGATTEICPWHTGRPVQQYHLSSRCPSGDGRGGEPGRPVALTDSGTGRSAAD